MSKELERQLKYLDRKEYKILNKKENQLFKEKIEPVIDKIQSKIPKKLMSTLESAFFQGFKLVFEKGHLYIDKTYNKERLKLEYYLNNHAVDKKMNRRHIKRLDKQSDKSQRLNSFISVVEGGVLGALGIGLPDIPIFISVIIKNIHEIAYSYGYNPETEIEKTYILLLICGAMSKGKKQRAFNEEIDLLGKKIDQHCYMETELEKQMRITASVLSEAMLTAKFIQGFAIVGVVGGLVNYSIIKRIGEYASLKYKKRYLNKKAG
ncbi:MAG: EcsC family protein [Clostridiaceae bacterium]